MIKFILKQKFLKTNLNLQDGWEEGNIQKTWFPGFLEA